MQFTLTSGYVMQFPLSSGNLALGQLSFTSQPTLPAVADSMTVSCGQKAERKKDGGGGGTFCAILLSRTCGDLKMRLHSTEESLKKQSASPVSFKPCCQADKHSFSGIGGGKEKFYLIHLFQSFPKPADLSSL